MKQGKNRKNVVGARLRRALTILLLMVGIITASAQIRTVTGSITDAADGEPLIGASVMVKETKAGVVTDAEGRFSTKVSQGQTLVISYVGYITKSVKYTGQAKLDVTLSVDNSTLDEVVVVGYGVMKRSDITGSVVSVGEKDIKNILVLQNWLERIRKEVINKALSIKRISEFLNFPILAQPTLKKI